MSSTGEKEINSMVTGSLSNIRILIMFGVLGGALLIGSTIQDQNTKVCFWLALILVIIALINLNLSFSFYIKLRNEKGIQGQRGERGDKGPKGFPGRCELNLDTQCEIKNCRAKITDKMLKQCNHYSDLTNMRDVDRTVDDNKILSKYNQWVNIIDEKCKSKQNEDKFFEDVFKDSSKYCLE